MTLSDLLLSIGVVGTIQPETFALVDMIVEDSAFSNRTKASAVCDAYFLHFDTYYPAISNYLNDNS